MKFNLLLSSAILICLLACFCKLSSAFQGIPGIYCGVESCYDVLGASRDSAQDQITKLYRSLARKWHPDRFHQPDEKAKATDKFRQIATAYEVLKDEESRKDYDDMLDDPEAYYRHYYRYYRRFNGTKVNAFIVIAGVVIVASLCQYYAKLSMYKHSIDTNASVQANRFIAIELARQRGLLPISEKKLAKENKDIPKSRQRIKEEIRTMENEIIRKIIEEKMDMSKPSISDIFIFQIFLLPIAIYNYLKWYIRWVYLFDFKKEEYGDEEKEYLIYKYLYQVDKNLTLNDDIKVLIKQDLHVKSNFDKWIKQKQDEIREKLAEKASYKKYRRYMKKGGPGQITFLDD